MQDKETDKGTGKNTPKLPLSSEEDVAEYCGSSSPSVAYATSKQSPVYNLSELMFGSLLASYVLGFVGVAGARAKEVFDLAFVLTADNVMNTLVLPMTAPLLISITYAYLTGSMYVTYQAVLLTMDTMPLSRLKIDFFLALLHALSFGLSLLLPFWFPLFLSLACFVAIWRQSIEHRNLLRKLHELFYHEKPDRASVSDAASTFNSEVQDCLRQTAYNQLAGWRPSSKKFKAASVCFFFMPLVAMYGARARELHPQPIVWTVLSIGMSALICLLVSLYSSKTLGHRAGFLYHNTRSDMDQQYHKLLKHLYRWKQKHENSLEQ